MSLAGLVEIFNAGYSGYVLPVQVDEDDLRHHIGYHDIDLEASRIASTKDGVVGVVLLGIRGDRSWIGGLGIHPAYRRQGIGRELMQAAIAESRNRGIETVQLEVITSNTPAYQLYQHLGFLTRRRLLVLQRQPGPVARVEKVDVKSVEASEIQPLYSAFHQNPPPWQRGFASFDRSTQAWIITSGPQPAAYVIGFASGSTLHILDTACAPGQEIALSSLVMYLHRLYPEAAGRLVNLGEDEPSWPVLAALNWQEVLSQYEMILPLTHT